jgi:predicted DNA binding CopG/RHH family protein
MAAQTLKYLNTKKQISINLKQSDLDFIKQRAADIGIPYQSIIQTLVHNYSHNKLNINI